MTKECAKCNQKKSLEDFNRDKKSSTGRSSWCKECSNVRCSIWHNKNRSKANKRARDRYATDPFFREEARRRDKCYVAANKSRANRYRANKLKAAPSWLTKEMRDAIYNIYASCPRGWHVDHIVPLQGEGVCGLHVPWNLQHLPAAVNCRKGNRLAS